MYLFSVKTAHNLSYALFCLADPDLKSAVACSCNGHGFACTVCCPVCKKRIPERKMSYWYPASKTIPTAFEKGFLPATIRPEFHLRIMTMNVIFVKRKQNTGERRDAAVGTNKLFAVVSFSSH